MEAAATIRSLHEKQRAAAELEPEVIPAFTADELDRLATACGHPLPPELRSLLQTEGVFAFAPEVYFENVGYFCLAPPETMIDDAANLRKAAEENDWELPPCCSLSLVNNGFIAYDLEKKMIVAIDGDDGEVSETGIDLEGLYDEYARLWAAELEG